MKRKSNYYFICNNGHLTIGDNKKQKCGASVKQMVFEKGPRNKWVMAEGVKKPCAADVIETHDIPEELKYDEVWDEKAAVAFLIGQKIDADFILSLQNEFSKLHGLIKEISNARK